MNISNNIRKYPLLLHVIHVLLISQLNSQDNHRIPIDWVNHYGIESQNGIAMWNQDWNSGVLLFDGTFAHDPNRYGEWVTHEMAHSQVDSILDTTLTDSWFHYKQGDYLQDELDVGLKAMGENRLIKLNAYKRSFGGPSNQYRLIDGTNAPLQQSYGIQYQSEKDKQFIWAGVGHFITQNGIPDSDSWGEMSSKIASSGLTYIKTNHQSQLDISFQQFQNTRQIIHSNYDYSGKQFINRHRLSTVFKKELKWDLDTYIGFDSHSRYMMDTTTTSQEWQRMYHGLTTKSLNLNWGFILSPYEDTESTYDVKYEQQYGSFRVSGQLSKNLQPRHITFWHQSSEMLETWKKKFIQLQYAHNRGDLSFQAGNNASDRWVRFNYDNNTPYIPMLSSDEPNLVNVNYISIQSNINLWKDWTLHGAFTGVDSVNILTDGVGQKVYAALSGRHWFFSKTMDFRFTLSANGWLNRLDDIQFDFLSGEMKLNQSSGNLNNIWILNLDIEAVVSSFIIRYTMKNILAAIYSGNPNYEYSFHHDFPALGRQMTISFEWHFYD